MPSFATLLDACVHHASHQPAELAFRLLGDGERETGELSFEQLLERAASVARFLVGQTAPGDRVLLLFHPGLDLVGALYGCFLAGRIAVPCYPPRPKRKVLVDLRAIAEDCGATLALSHGMLAAQLPVWLREQLEWSGLRVVTTDELACSAASTSGLPGVTAGDVAFLQYTSGSTGAPKGVVVTHGNVIANLEMIRDMFAQGERSSGVIWLPPYHDMGLIGGILQPVFLGRPVTLMPPTAFIQKPVRWLRAISETRATTSGGPNFAYDLCVDRIDDEELAGLDLSSWQVAFNGAEPVRLSTLRRFAERFARCGFRREAFLPCYGMAETTLLVSGLAVEQAPYEAPLPGEDATGGSEARGPGGERAAPARTAVSCGRPAPRTEVRAVDPESRRPLGDDAVGELWIASPSVARGYWGNPERTTEVFGATLATGSDPVPDPDRRYLRTGDLGFLRGGDVFVTGRIKDLLIIRGKNFYPQDVEATAAAAHPALVPGHTAAFSIERDGQEHVALVQEVDRSHLRGLDAAAAAAVIAAIRREVAELLALQLDTVALVKPATIAKTSSGKVRRFRCKQELLEGSLQLVACSRASAAASAAAEAAVAPAPRSRPLAAGEHEPLPAAAIAAWLRLRLGEELQEAVPAEHDGKDFADHGFDSLQLATISGDLADWIGLQLSPAVMHEHPTVARLAEHLAAVHSVVHAMADRTAEDKRKIFRDAQTERPLRHASLDDIPERHYRIAAFTEVAELGKRQELLLGTGVHSPFYMCHDGIGSAHTRMAGRDYLNYSSNNYLALCEHPDALREVTEAVLRHGTSVAASRIVSGERPLHAQLEQELAAFLGVEEALVLVAGNLTNTTLVGHLVGPDDLILYDQLSHDSMLQGARLSGADAIAFPHNDHRRVDKLLADKRRRYDKVLVFTEGAFSMDGDIPDLARFVEIKERHRALLMVDEALSIGVVGATGRGVTEHCGVDPRRIDVLMGVLSKALAGCGGYLAGSHPLIHYLRYSLPGFLYTTGMSPANTAASLAALRILQREPWRVHELQRRARLFVALARAAGLDTGRSKDTSIVPIIVGDPLTCMRLYQRLHDDAINVQPILYPAVPANASRLRFFLSCAHAEDELRWTIDRVAHHLGELRAGRPAATLATAAAGASR